MTLHRYPVQLLVTSPDPALARQVRALLAAYELPCAVMEGPRNCEQAPLCRWFKDAPLSEVPSLNRLIQVSRLPRLLRRLIWAFALNIDRQRANHAGTFAITSIASFGIETVTALFPGPCLISYGLVRDGTMEIIFHWDHRIYDGVPVGSILDRMEAVMNNEIAEEIIASGRIRSIA